MAFKGEMKSCFAVLVPRLKEKLLKKGVVVSHTLSGDLVSAYPSHFASGLHQVFLKAGCTHVNFDTFLVGDQPENQHLRTPFLNELCMCQRLYLMLKHLKY